jgi:hypothetical protein
MTSDLEGNPSRPWPAHARPTSSSGVAGRGPCAGRGSNTHGPPKGYSLLWPCAGSTRPSRGCCWGGQPPPAIAAPQASLRQAKFDHKARRRALGTPREARRLGGPSRTPPSGERPRTRPPPSRRGGGPRLTLNNLLQGQHLRRSLRDLAGSGRTKASPSGSDAEADPETRPAKATLGDSGRPDGGRGTLAFPTT